MSMESALEAPWRVRTGSPTGFQRLTPGLLQADQATGRFAGLPDRVAAYGQLPAAFKAAASRLRLPRTVPAIDWRFRFTMAWGRGRGGRPIVRPSAPLRQEAPGLSPMHAKAIDRGPIEAGPILRRDPALTEDSPRDPTWSAVP